MGLKTLWYGPYACGKTAIASTMSEVGHIGVIDTEQRWQWYTVPHPTQAPKPCEYEGVEIPAYAHPRALRQDVPWLPRVDSKHVIWVVQTMEPNLISACIKTWANDKSIVGQVLDSVSVVWDLYSDDAYARQQEDADKQEDGVSRIGGLAWVAAKKAMRRMTYAQMAGGQHFIQIAHKQELLNKKMEVIGAKPWAEKSTAKWIDVVFQVVRDDGKAPKCQVMLQKVLGGKGMEGLKEGMQIEEPTFRKILELAGAAEGIGMSGPTDMEEIERRAGMLVNRAASLPEPTSGTNN